MTELNIEDRFRHLVISRKRKQYKFAHFSDFNNCLEHPRGSDPQVTGNALSNFFGDKKVTVELAAGNAQFCLELARRHPEERFLAVDIKSDRLYTSAKLALEENIPNIMFLRMNLDELSRVMPVKSISELWLTFPDPFPKKKNQRKRLTHPRFQEQYRAILRHDATLKFKTDNRELFLWSLEQFVANSWQLLELSFDLHESHLAEEYKIKTYYEERFTNEGIPTNFVNLCSTDI